MTHALVRVEAESEQALTSAISAIEARLREHPVTVDVSVARSREFVCDRHGPRAPFEAVVPVIDGVAIWPHRVTCSECGCELRLVEVDGG